MDIIAVLFMPFFGTLIGSAAVFFIRKKPDEGLTRILLGFASGVMIAASVWSLILPSIEMSKSRGMPGYLPPAVGFALGVCFMVVLDKAAGRLETERTGIESRTAMMLLAITIHNIPEGMAVGVALAGALNGSSQIAMAEAFALSLGIAIQNYPEGAIVSTPLRCAGMCKTKSFFYGALSGAVEPVASAITIMLTGAISALLPYLLSFASGAMIFVTIGELIPQAHSKTKGPTISAAAGFMIMMILDVALG